MYVRYFNIMDPFLSELANDIIQVKKGVVIMKEGEVGRCAYFLIKGKLVVEKQIGGESVVIAEVHPKDLVGELAILDDAPRSATVTTIEDSVLVVLNKNRIRTLIRRTPAVAEVILKLLCQKLRNTQLRQAGSQRLTDPICWLKILEILKLSLKATDYAQTAYTEFVGHLTFLLELPPSSTREIVRRLEEGRLIETDGRLLTGVNEETIDLFCRLCREEYLNTPIHSVSDYKVYRTARMIVAQCETILQKKNFVEIAQPRLLQILLNSALWKSLRYRFQHQRALAMIQRLTENRLISQAQEGMILHLDRMNLLPAPDTEIKTYEQVRAILLEPDSGPTPSK